MIDITKKTEIEALSSWIIDETKKAGIYASDIFYSEGYNNRLSLLDGEIEESLSGNSEGIGIRTIMSDGRQGIAYGNILDRLSVKELIEWSVSNCRNSEPEEGISLYDGKVTENPPIPLFDSEITEITTDQRMSYCMKVNDYAKSLDPRIISVRRAGWSDGCNSIFYCNSNGFSGWQRGSRASCGAVLLAKDGDSLEMGSYGESARRLEEINTIDITSEAARKTLSSLGSSLLKTGIYSVILDRESMADIIGIVGDLFCASDVHSGHSMMQGKLGTKVASTAVTLTDNARLPWRSGSADWDSEGVPTTETVLIRDGVADSYLYNLQYALKDNVTSTGNAYRALSSLPDVSTSNLILQPGSESRDNLISNVKKGFYITEFMGLHTINSVSGEFSVGAKGLAIEDGKLTRAISGVTIASNLMDFIKKITAVASDLKFFGSVAAPTVVVEGVTIAGD